MSYQNRRYRVVDGRLKKRWDSPTEGWYMTKIEAWDVEEKRLKKAADVARTDAARAARDKNRKEKEVAKVAPKAAEKAVWTFGQPQAEGDEAA